MSRRQLVEIAKALALRPQLLILDEATSALTAADVERVFELLHELRAKGLALLYISHRMHEIAALADTCSVFRNGRHVETFPHGTRTDQEIVRLMIGRDITQVYPPKPAANDRRRTLSRGHDLSWGDRLTELSFAVGKGEIVGLGGLDGQGQRELMLALFGVLRGVEGNVRLDGQPYRPAARPMPSRRPAAWRWCPRTARPRACCCRWRSATISASRPSAARAGWASSTARQKIGRSTR